MLKTVPYLSISLLLFFFWKNKKGRNFLDVFRTGLTGSGQAGPTSQREKLLAGFPDRPDRGQAGRSNLTGPGQVGPAGQRAIFARWFSGPA